MARTKKNAVLEAMPSGLFGEAAAFTAAMQSLALVEQSLRVALRHVDRLEENDETWHEDLHAVGQVLELAEEQVQRLRTTPPPDRVTLTRQWNLVGVVIRMLADSRLPKDDLLQRSLRAMTAEFDVLPALWEAIVFEQRRA